ncbi:MAG: DUF1810 domain-containing protein [Erythrobacter sp.]|jgi:uncharacterized protein (DUF1810 family)|uniref:DUF1810 domain-containing protein n=1 Tax=Qipengyuania citrea TaxID=225971 RepID=UPI001A5B8CE0|nr:DUF1810 domain-containing protein [Qipengyuania citrea]MBL4718904.1 DUF1810 domain-containing protein [Erythrobacter sp.]MCP2018552.1 uncharacterized protein (DUF1810 family) [Qipengyuania citrea]MDE0902366.1 DUF1810 domain-containing protein [Erythrobacter sp.]
MSTTTTIEPAGFAHFLTAQDGGVFERALDEIRAGAKTSHWMWFVFPQIAGLGKSATAHKFALADRHAARAYCRHEDLGPRLFEATEAMLDWAGTMDARDILGAVDAMKFRSSMTLFEAACDDEDTQVFAHALDQFFGGERDPLTLAKL